jgi:hypothetical protein
VFTIQVEGQRWLKGPDRVAGRHNRRSGRSKLTLPEPWVRAGQTFADSGEIAQVTELATAQQFFGPSRLSRASSIDPNRTCDSGRETCRPTRASRSST